jgi:hypothetical protein
MKIHSVLLAILAFAPAGMWADEKPNLSGTWKLDMQRSRFDTIAAPKSGVLKIDHQEPKIHIAVDMATKHGNSMETLDLTTDGAEQKVTVDGQTATASAYWEDGQHLVIQVSRDMANGKEVETRRMHIGDKGKMLTTVLTLQDPAGQKSAYGFYVKE